MELLIFVAVVFVAVLVTVGPLLFVKLRKSRRADIAFERGIELATLLIHLPPASEDTDANGRDVRDLVDENISKAQIIYNIIASTMQKNFKNRWHGQRHFSFEITGAKGFVYLYATVPADMVEVLKQAITSAYPSTRLELATEHNIFSEVGGINSVVGGELNLKESFAYPIATYQDLKRDALQSLLNALSSLDAADGAAIQILYRPVEDAWRKQASAHASKKRKGDDGSGASAMAKQLMTALVKPPEDKKENPAPKKELSSLEQSVLDAIDDKTRYAGFEVTIRIVASSNILQRSQAIVNNIVASFSLFDAPGKNGFKYEPAKDPSKLVADYALRAFTYRRKRNIMNAVELATIFHFPDQRSIPTSQLTRQESKQVDGPRNMPDSGLLLGFNVFRGVKKPIRLALKDRQRHLYAVGQTGTGKSTFLESLALQDMLNGDGFAFVDPHGDTAEKLLSMVPKERTEDVIYFCPSDMDYPMGLNLFEYTKADQKDFLVQETLNMLQKLYDPQHQGIMGPRYEHIFRNAALAIMADPKGGTFVDVPKLFRDPDFLKEKLKHVKDPSVLDFWQKEYPASQRSNESGEVTSWFVSKFGAFLSNEMMRNIIGQTKSAFDLRYIMDNKKILLVNLSKGRTGELNSKLLGMIFVMKFQAAAMSRSDMPEEERKDFALYVDEFQNFSTDSFATIMSEARKFHLNLIVANQFTTQLTEEIRDAVFGNIGTVVSFRIGQNDVEALGRYFQPAFDGDDLLRVPNYNAIVRTLVGGVPTQPFSMATLPPFGKPSPQLAAALKQLSAAKYGKPKAVVEKEIFDRLSPPQAPKPAAPAFAGGQGGFGAPAGGFAAPATPKASSGSFLDDWLAKQRAAQPATGAASPLSTKPVAATTTASAGGVGWNAPNTATSPATMPSTSPPTLSPARSAGESTGSPSSTSIEGPVVHAAAPSMDQPHRAPDHTELVIPKHDHVVEPIKSAPTLASAAAEPTQVDATPDEGGNVSSTQLDEKEIHDIAAELKKDLTAAKPKKHKKLKPEVIKPEPFVTPKTDDLSVKPAPVAEPEPTEAPKPQPPIVAKNRTDEPAPDDTIFIDADGKLVLRDQDTEQSDTAQA